LPLKKLQCYVTNLKVVTLWYGAPEILLVSHTPPISFKEI
jgi:hypothetical protein